MATAKEKTEITELREELTSIRGEVSSVKDEVAGVKTDVALLKQSLEKVVEPALAGIQDTLKSLAYVPIKEFTDYQKLVDGRFTEMKKRTWKENSLSATMGALLTGLVMFIFNYFMGR